MYPAALVTAVGAGFITLPLARPELPYGRTGESTLKIATRALSVVLCMFVGVPQIANVPAIPAPLLPEIYR